MAVLVGDIKKKGRLFSMLFELTKPGVLENVIIKPNIIVCPTNEFTAEGSFPLSMSMFCLLGKTRRWRFR